MNQTRHRRSNSGAPDTRVSPAESYARRLRSGEAAAVREVRKRIARILSHSGLNIPGPERDDLEQEVITEIWQAVNRPSFDVSGGFWGFVELVTARRGIDWLRAQRNDLALPPDLHSEQRGPQQRMLRRQQAELVTEILAGLEPRCRELIVLRLRDDLSYREIARRTDKSEGALRVQFYRCIRSARKLMDSRRSASEDPAAPKGVNP